MEANTSKTQASVQIKQYRERYGNEVFLLACYASFPLTLTSDLVYCLRENFLPDSDWQISPVFLMSGIVEGLQHDLYEISAPVRREFLHALRVQHGDDFEAALTRLEAFMAAYVRHRLGQGIQTASCLMGLGEEMRWMALACLNPGEVRDAIKHYLKQISEMTDARERVRLATVLDSYAALLESEGMNLKLIRWADCVEKGEEIETDDPIEGWLEAQGISLKKLTFDAVELVPESELRSEAQNVIKTLTFQTIKVNDQGEIVDRPDCEAYYFEEALGNDVTPLKMIAIPSGRFLMGSPLTKKERDGDESPQHWVNVPPFFISQTPITQAQWRFISKQPKVEIDLETEPFFKGDRLPIESVTWNEAVEFCQRLSVFTRRQEYRLPSEAEWEYACRAGTSTPFAFGETITTNLVNFNGDFTYGEAPTGIDRNKTTEVASFEPNALGLYDMHGNVYEWCQDRWHETYEGAPEDGSAWESGDDERRVLRGGSWVILPAYCRSAYRSRLVPAERYNFIGFRVVCALPRTSFTSAL